MHLLDLSFPTPEENLACDEALLDGCESGSGPETLRFWESSSYFAVLGYSNRADGEIDLTACRRDSIPVLRRASGGGTVLQGPGCLNYALILDIRKHDYLSGITRTNAELMKRLADVLTPLTGCTVHVRGFTDLAIREYKFSGNAQRRRKNFVLFHGTFLLNFDLSRVSTYLKQPARQPEYRRDRVHSDFIFNLGIAANAVKQTLARGWQADQTHPGPPHDHLRRLVCEKYSKDDWNLRF